MRLYDELVDIAGEENVKCDEPMSRHTTFRIGGAADYFVTPVSSEQIARCIRLLRESGTRYYIIGNGSNLLVSDKGCRGVIIQLGKNFSTLEIEGEEIRVQAGAMLSGVARAAMNEGLSGMEFASGIPGTIGGAVCMNAGAYGGEMKDIITEITVLENGRVKTMTAAEALFRYRGSVIMDCGMLVLEARLKLKRGDKQAIADTMAELNAKRNEKQPVELPSAGSTFKRPHGHFAAQLIEECGLKGYSVGQAQVSPKHSGFVVNNGGATAAEVMRLIKHVQRVVKEKTGVSLEPEVRIIGQW